ncbi:MAG: NAD(P)/FAD-dependent oxidoreductase [Candidatus Scalindua sp. AMX11]|nr:MAG: NAD(P)/FAD-dependent oxidoreductase [Candidatus Scalindua sp.]NOG85532.1 NAD(P)/FAD-dependent oxidoreductase [Planctomycetota bacterium]RZV90220.1 MAG: NAD(P)/FAD-dependent oxidoreductase [Candidatus Scalindua sp. SCAELEC01]TDE65005.1 MAG: NAD(P)/FAD-dependent oxidoreductase [Candidatus Scalindua sp. AMX11]GJQ59560.1 MAG: phytoene dehydrogenase [Candidatus Scalindua sp.]
MSEKESKYDVIILGAGIGGLICGTFLAKSGKKVLIIEQHYLPGGYCTAFKRKGFTFDAAVHHIGGCGTWSIVGRCFKELGIEIEFLQLDPMDSLNFPTFSIDVPANLDDYIDLLKTNFVSESNTISAFFKEFVGLYRSTVRSKANELLMKYKDLTYKEMLDMFFTDERLKMVLSAQWGYIGSPPHEASAIGMCQMLVNYLKDGAFYPIGSTQNFADAITQKFIDYGGQIMLSSKVDRIWAKDKLVKGVITDRGKEYRADIFVSNIDPGQAFFKLFDNQKIDESYLHKIRAMKESVSFFLLYLGIDNEIDLKGLKRGFYHTSKDLSFSDNGWFYISVPTRSDATLAPNGKQIITVVVSLKERFDEIEDFDSFREKMTKYTMNYLKTLVPNIQNHIDVVETGTPKTLKRYTLNSQGAAYGWAVTVDQTWSNRLLHTTPFKNLFLAGHWTNPGPGICAVVSSGWRVANMILNN